MGRGERNGQTHQKQPHAKDKGESKDVPDPQYAANEHHARQNHRPAAGAPFGSSKYEQEESENGGSLVTGRGYKPPPFRVDADMGQPTSVGKDLEFADRTPHQDGGHSVAELVDPGGKDKEGIQNKLEEGNVHADQDENSDQQKATVPLESFSEILAPGFLGGGFRVTESIVVVAVAIVDIDINITFQSRVSYC